MIFLAMFVDSTRGLMSAGAHEVGCAHSEVMAPQQQWPAQQLSLPAIVGLSANNESDGCPCTSR
jgi:hypothetical protein